MEHATTFILCSHEYKHEINNVDTDKAQQHNGKKIDNTME